MSKSLGGIRNDHGRRPGFSPIRGTNPQETTPSNAGNTHNTLAQVPGTSPLRLRDQGFVSQSSAGNLDSSPRTHRNLSLAEAAFAMEDEVIDGGYYVPPKFGPNESNKQR